MIIIFDGMVFVSKLFTTYLKIIYMNSINQQQPENNNEDLAGKDGIKKIKELAEKSSNCFFCTALKTGQPFKTRPMAVQKVDDEGNLWFLSASDSHTNKEIAEDQHVQLLFRGSTHSGFLNLYGTASISRDKKMIDELWEPLIKTWFTEGKEDPRITVIKVTPSEAYYWDNKHGNAVAFVKMAVGAAIGKTLDDSVEGMIQM